MLSHDTTSGVTADFTPAPVDDADVAWLLRALFSTPAAEVARTDPPTCGLDAAFERIDRHLAWFDDEARAGREVA